MTNNQRQALTQFLKFAVTGTIGACVDFGVYNLLKRGIGWNPTFLVSGLTLSGANMVSVFLAIVSNYTINRLWTFRDRQGDVFKQGAQYFGLNLITWALNQLVMAFFAFHVPLMALLFGTQKDNAAKALAIGIILIVNFTGSRLFIFNKKTVPLEA
jgi:putative flippase GtrA